MKCLLPHEANSYLNQIGMKIGDWNRIADTTSRNGSGSKTSYQAPRDALQLFCFSRHVAGWLPKGEWKILQIDNSTSFDRNTASIFSGLLFGSGEAPSLVENRTFLLEFGANKDVSKKTELLISNLIFVLLLLECHAYLVSSKSTEGQLLAIQDGFIYFVSRDKNESAAEVLLKKFERDPLTFPEWVIEIVAENRT